MDSWATANRLNSYLCDFKVETDSFPLDRGRSRAPTRDNGALSCASRHTNLLAAVRWNGPIVSPTPPGADRKSGLNVRCRFTSVIQSAKQCEIWFYLAIMKPN